MSYSLKRRLMISAFLSISALLFLSTSQAQTSDYSIVATRLNNNQPIISLQNFEDAFNNDRTYRREYNEQGGNINGPSMLRIPDWIPADKRADPRAQYYLYFADHGGNYIRMAWASNITGPWTLYSIGLDDSGRAINTRDRGVFALPSRTDERFLVRQNGRDFYINRHVASPDVIADDENQKIIMYFHAPTNNPNGQNDTQKTVASTSDYGLDFNDGLHSSFLTRSYARTFVYKGELYALVADRIYRAPSIDDPFSNRDNVNFLERDLWEQSNARPFRNYFVVDPNPNDIADLGSLRVRHNDVYLDGDTLHIFFTVRSGAPERVLHTTIDLTQPYDEWSAAGNNANPTEVLRPELAWEGVNAPIEPSGGGGIDGLVHQLRDPDVFQDDDGKLYLLYSGSGEAAIGIAELSITPKGVQTQEGDKLVHIEKNNENFAIDGNRGGANAQNVYIWQSRTSNINQQWLEIDRGDGFYSYQKNDTDFCLDGGSGGQNGQTVYLWECNTRNQNQQWRKVNTGSGAVRIEKRNAPGFSLDAGRGGSNGQDLYLWSSNNNNVNQQWNITPLD